MRNPLAIPSPFGQPNVWGTPLKLHPIAQIPKGIPQSMKTRTLWPCIPKPIQITVSRSSSKTLDHLYVFNPDVAVLPDSPLESISRRATIYQGRSGSSPMSWKRLACSARCPSCLYPSQSLFWWSRPPSHLGRETVRDVSAAATGARIFGRDEEWRRSANFLKIVNEGCSRLQISRIGPVLDTHEITWDTPGRRLTKTVCVDEDVGETARWTLGLITVTMRKTLSLGLQVPPQKV